MVPHRLLSEAMCLQSSPFWASVRQTAAACMHHRYKHLVPKTIPDLPHFVAAKSLTQAATTDKVDRDPPRPGTVEGVDCVAAALIVAALVIRIQLQTGKNCASVLTAVTGPSDHDRGTSVAASFIPSCTGLNRQAILVPGLAKRVVAPASFSRDAAYALIMATRDAISVM